MFLPASFTLYPRKKRTILYFVCCAVFVAIGIKVTLIVVRKVGRTTEQRKRGRVQGR